jgi:hypothetical protein
MIRADHRRRRKMRRNDSASVFASAGPRATGLLAAL